MLRRRAEPGGDEQGAELVAVQRDDVRLIVHSRSLHLGRPRVIQESFLDRVLAEPGDRAQPPGDGSPRPASCLQVAPVRQCLPQPRLDPGRTVCNLRICHSSNLITDKCAYWTALMAR
jgi:hypothetical protein